MRKSIELVLTRIRLSWGLVILTAMVFLWISCGNQEKGLITVPKGAQAGDLVGLESCSYKTKAEVEYAAECGIL